MKNHHHNKYLAKTQTDQEVDKKITKTIMIQKTISRAIMMEDIRTQETGIMMVIEEMVIEGIEEKSMLQIVTINQAMIILLRNKRIEKQKCVPKWKGYNIYYKLGKLPKRI